MYKDVEIDESCLGRGGNLVESAVRAIHSMWKSPGDKQTGKKKI